MAAPGPLDGILVLEVANWIAGPCCGALLADLGAKVIKVEPPEGDSMRYVQRQPYSKEGKPQQNGEVIDHGFTLDNRGKQSIAVNLASDEGQRIVRELAQKADVFLTNLLPVRLTRFGLDYATIEKLNPRSVYCSVSGWGLAGPDPDRLAFDMTAFFARGGVLGAVGHPGQPPIKPRSGQGDHQTGLAAFSAILAALLLRQRTGKGSLCEASLIRAASWNLSEDLAAVLVDGKHPPKAELADDPVMGRVYEVAGGRWIIVMMPFREAYYWPRFCAALGKPEWADGARFSGHRGRQGLSLEIEQIFATDTMGRWLDRLEEAGCIAGPIAELPEVCTDPQLRANGAFQKVSHPVAGDFETVGAPFNIHGADVRVRGPGPEPGADTESVLAEHLGMDKARAKVLVEAGVLGYRPLEGSPLANWTSKL